MSQQSSFVRQARRSLRFDALVLGVSVFFGGASCSSPHRSAAESVPTHGVESSVETRSRHRQVSTQRGAYPLIVRRLDLVLGGDFSKEALEAFNFPPSAVGSFVCPIRDVRTDALLTDAIAPPVSTSEHDVAHGRVRGVLSDSMHANWWTTRSDLQEFAALVPPESAADDWHLDPTALRQLLISSDPPRFRRDLGAWWGKGNDDTLLSEPLVERGSLAQLETLVGVLIDRALATGTFTGLGTAPIAEAEYHEADSRRTEFALSVTCVADLDQPLAGAWTGYPMTIAPFVLLELDHAHVEIELHGRGIDQQPTAPLGRLDVSGVFEAKVSIHADGRVAPLGYDTDAHLDCVLEGAFDVSRRQWLE